MTVYDENGTRYEKENIVGEFLDHFKNFLGTKDIIPNFPTNSVIFANKLSKEEAERMVRPVMKRAMEVFNLLMKKSIENADGFKFHQGCLRIREMPYDSNCSIGWRNILKWRDKVRQHVYYKFGNRKSVSAWYDKWSIEGPLCEFISAREIYDARLSSDYNVASLIQNGNWCWPMEWTSKYPFLNMLQVPSLIDDAYDEVVWVTRAGHKTKFVTRIVWQDIWKNILEEFSKLNENRNIWIIFRRLVIGEVVYFVWQERSTRLVKNTKRRTENLVQVITETIKVRMISFIVKESDTAKEVEEKWNVKLKRNYVQNSMGSKANRVKAQSENNSQHASARGGGRGLKGGRGGRGEESGVRGEVSGGRGQTSGGMGQSSDGRGQRGSGKGQRGGGRCQRGGDRGQKNAMQEDEILNQLNLEYMGELMLQEEEKREAEHKAQLEVYDKEALRLNLEEQAKYEREDEERLREQREEEEWDKRHDYFHPSIWTKEESYD
ncbi:hypothetical protein Tco_1429575 [Tanacetum coccineum]